MSWVCDHCYSLMDEISEGNNRNKIECPNCGTYWYVDDDDEYINDGSGWNASDAGEDDDTDEESISVYDAALIWRSHGCDEDYTFGYTEEDLEDALR